MKGGLMQRLVKIIPLIKPYRWRLTILWGLSLLGTGVGLSYPLFAKVFIDELLKGSYQVLLWVVGLGLAFNLLSFLLGLLNNYLYTQTTLEILQGMRVDLYRHLLRLSPRFFSRTRVGEIVNRLNGDMAEVQGMAMEVVLGLATNILTLVVAAGVVVWLNWQLALAATMLMPLALYIVWVMRPRLIQEAKGIREQNGVLSAFLVECLVGIKFIQSYSLEERTAQRYRGHNQALNNNVLKYQVLSGLASGLPSMVIALSTAIIFYLGGKMVLEGTLTVGGLVAFAAYQGRVVGPVQGILGLYLRVQRGLVALERVQEFRDLIPEVEESPRAVELHQSQGRIVLQEVGFSYQQGKTALERVSMEIPAGKVTALVGVSGAGKSTVIDLILRLYDPDYGRITIDGIELKDVALTSLRRQVVLVAQETHLFEGTIYENISYPQPKATRLEVERAVRMAGLNEFIASLPLGFATLIGERGQQLSGGQRQRVAIARAILLNPTVLILDEATNSLDSLTTRQIFTELESFMAGRTTLVVTHHMSGILRADRVILLEQGMVLAQGSHQELYQQEQLYRKMWEAVGS